MKAVSIVQMENSCACGIKSHIKGGASLFAHMATNSSDVQALNFPANDVYTIEVIVTGIKQYGDEWDQSKNGIAVGTVVVPEFASTILLFAIFSSLIVLITTLGRSLKIEATVARHEGFGETQ